MTIKTVAGPFKTSQEAEETAATLGTQYSAFGVYRKDEEGYITDVQDYYVEQDTSIEPDRLFGYNKDVFLRKQYK